MMLSCEVRCLLPQGSAGMIPRCILPIAITIFLAGCAGDQLGGGCDSADNMNYVAGSAHCFGIRTHVPKSGSAKTLVVALHGDMSGGATPITSSLRSSRHTYSAQ